MRATSREFARYDQVDKPQEYHLAEGADEGPSTRVPDPGCDLGQFLHGGEEGSGASRRSWAKRCETSGSRFSTTPESIRRSTIARKSTSSISSRRPRSRTTPVPSQRHGSVNQGYFPIKETSDIHPDLVEGWVFCRQAFDFDPQHPVRVEVLAAPRNGAVLPCSPRARTAHLPVMQAISPPSARTRTCTTGG